MGFVVFIFLLLIVVGVLASCIKLYLRHMHM